MGRCRDASQRGVSLFEVVVSMALLVSGVLGVVLSMSTSAGEAMVTRERLRAVEAARSALERAAALPFDQVFARLNSTASDDPGGAGSAPGAGFDVPGLAARAGDPDGLAGRYVFPEDSATGALSEVPDNRFAGLGRDLNGDGDGTDANVSATYRLLPVTAIVEWSGVAGESSVELTTILRGTR